MFSQQGIVLGVEFCLRLRLFRMLLNAGANQRGDCLELFGDSCNLMINLRMQLWPYLYSLAADVSFHRGTMLRMLAFDFPDDESARKCMDEFMLGRALLVCPVLREGARTRKVYLPKGAGWYAFESGAFYHGGQWIEVDAPLQSIPLFVRAGAILPLGLAVQYADEPNDQPLGLRVYTGDDAQFTLYNDVGDGYGYEQGDMGMLSLHWDDKKAILTQNPSGDISYIPKSIEVIVIR